MSGGSLVTLATGQLTPMNVVTDGTNVYWTAQSGSVMQVSVSGGAPIVLASGQASPWGVATDGTNVYFTNSGASSQLNNEGSLILAGPKGTGSVGTGSVMAVPVGGGTVVTLVSGLTEPAGIATDGTSVFWDDFADGSVNQVSIAGGSPTTLASNLGHPGAMATDGTNVYLATLTMYASPGDTANSPGSVLQISLK